MTGDAPRSETDPIETGPRLAVLVAGTCSVLALALVFFALRTRPEASHPPLPGGEPQPIRFTYAGNWSPNGGPYYGAFETWVTPIDARSGGRRCDVAVSNPQGFDVAISNGIDRCFSDGLWAPDVRGSHGTFIANVGSGHADLVAVGDTGIEVRFQRGHGWGNRWTGATPSGNLTAGVPYFGTEGTYFADVTGTGESAAIVINHAPTYGNGMVVRRMARNAAGEPVAFAPNEVWSSDDFHGARGTFFADVTGDGRADAIAVDQGVRVHRSSGSLFGPEQIWLARLEGDLDWVLFADVDGDGRADLIYQASDGVRVRRSDGRSFDPRQAGLPVALEGRPAHEHGVFACDVTGDGRADLVFFDDRGIQVYRAIPGG